MNIQNLQNISFRYIQFYSDTKLEVTHKKISEFNWPHFVQLLTQHACLFKRSKINNFSGLTECYT